MNPARRARSRSIRRMGSTSVLVIVLVLAAAVLGGACGDDDGIGASSRGDVPPWGLADIELPDTEVEVGAVLADMPEQVDGRPRTEPFESVSPMVHYGTEDEQGMTLFAIPAEQIGESADVMLTPLEWLAGARSEMEMVEGSSLGAGQPIAWIAGSTSLEEPAGVVVTMYMAAWGEPDGDWVFFVTADSRSGRASLVNSFVEILAG